MATYNWGTGQIDETSDVQQFNINEQALEEIQTERFFNTLKSYYTYRDGETAYTTRGKYTFKDMAHADLLEYFYHDRSWRNNQSFSMGMDMANVIGEDSTKRLQEFAYINSTYQNLPYFWNDPNRSFGSWLIDMGGAMIADPVNLVGFGIGGQAAKTAYKQAIKEAIKKKMAKEINKRIIEEAAKKATTTGLIKAVKKGALYEAGIGGGIASIHDAMLQTTAIHSNVADGFDIKRLGLSTAYGMGIGTLFGGAFSYGGFKLVSRNLKKHTFKNLTDLHNFGRSEITGKRLFADLTTRKQTHQFYKNMSKKQIDEIEAKSKVDSKDIDSKIKSLKETRSEGITSSDKPPKRPFNYTRMKGETFGTVIYIKSSAKQIASELEEKAGKITFEEIEDIANKWNLKPKELRKILDDFGTDGKELAGQMLAHDRILLKNSDDIIKLAKQLDDETLDDIGRKKILNELGEREALNHELMITKKQVQKNVAVALAAGRIERSSLKIAELIINPEDLRLKKLKIENSEAYWREVAKIDTDEQLADALSSVRKVDKWDLAAEYVNNNLLSSPDTHILNIFSSLIQSQWKPIEMLIRAANLSRRDRHRANIVAREALETYIHQYFYIMDGLKGAWRAIREGRPIMDSKQLKVDNNVRQGQLQRWANETVGLWFESVPVLGRPINRYVWKPITAAVTFPLRILSAGDEFLKQMTFKGRMAAQINSTIMREHPEILSGWNFRAFLPERLKGKAYLAKFKEYEKNYFQTNGKAISTQDMNVSGRVLSDADRLEVNDPLHYAREASYTNSAYSINPLTGKKEGRLTGQILRISSGKGKFLRVFGLHFINTPSNLLRWVAQRTPTWMSLGTFTGRAQFQLKHMLAKNKDGSFINPEAAAEASARIQAGYLLWTAAFTAAIMGKVTGGGSRDWKENKQREVTTGWQPYSYKTSDGRYISLNRLDPVFMPFMLAADMYEMFNDFFRYSDDLPEEVENKWSELFVGALMSITRNLTSKFYTKNLLETAEMFLGDGLSWSKDPTQKSAAFISRGIYKATPLSGGLRYMSRITNDHQKELWSFADRLRTLDPLRLFGSHNLVMPHRNALGEKIDRDRGWLFGIGGKTGIWSSPFAMTKWKNPIIAKFFEDREFNYKAPPKVDRRTHLDLRDIKDEDTGQTAYDYMLEQKTKILAYYPPLKRKASLKEIIEYEISNPNSKMYKYPKKIVAGDDYQQQFILSIIHKFEVAAYKKMWAHFPIFQKTLEKRGLHIKKEFGISLENWLNVVNQ